MSEDVQLPPEIDEQLEDRKDRELARRVALGQDFENFIRSPLGRYLTGRGEAERSELLESLALLDPRDNEKDMRRAQLQIAVIDKWQQWCAEAIREGVLAEHEFISRNQS